MRRLQNLLMWLQYGLIGLGLVLYLIDSDLVMLFLPIRYISPALLFAGGLAAVGSVILRRVPLKSSRSIRGSLAALTVVAGMGAFIVYRQFLIYEETEISFDHEGVTLVGTLYHPHAKKSLPPCVIIAQGSMKAPRRLYHVWADILVRSGIAVYSFDKRGTGKSGGTYESENNSSRKNLELLGADVAAAADMLAKRSDIDVRRIGVFGVSMGGWLGVIAAEKSSHVRYECLVSGPVVSVYEENLFSDLTGDGHRDSERPLSEIESIVDTLSSGGYDPLLGLTRLDIPIRYIYGGHDLSVPVKKSMKNIDRLRNSEGKPYDYLLFPEANHLIIKMSWPFDFAPGFPDSVAQWILQQSQVVTDTM